MAASCCQGPAAPTGNLLAACLLQVPAGSPGAAAIAAGAVLPPAAGQINVTGGGNPNLGTEKAETWTLGAIFQPEAIPGFSISVDYFNISLTDAVSSPTVDDVLSACFDAPSATNPFCGSEFISRSAFTGGLDGSPNEVRGLILQSSNLGLIATDGIDVSVRYATDITDSIGLNLSFDGTWTNSNTFQASPTGVNRECISFYSVNCGSLQPEFSFNQRTTVSFDDDFSLSLRWRYLSKFEQEPLDVIAQGPAFIGNSPLFGEVDFTKIPSESYFDLTGQWDVAENLVVTLTVQNLFNNQPAIVGSDIGSTAFNSGNVFPSSFDTLGRRYGLSAKIRF